MPCSDCKDEERCDRAGVCQQSPYVRVKPRAPLTEERILELWSERKNMPGTLHHSDEEETVLSFVRAVFAEAAVYGVNL